MEGSSINHSEGSTSPVIPNKKKGKQIEDEEVELEEEELIRENLEFVDAVYLGNPTKATAIRKFPIEFVCDAAELDSIRNYRDACIINREKVRTGDQYDEKLKWVIKFGDFRKQISVGEFDPSTDLFLLNTAGLAFRFDYIRKHKTEPVGFYLYSKTFGDWLGLTGLDSLFSTDLSERRINYDALHMFVTKYGSDIYNRLRSVKCVDPDNLGYAYYQTKNIDVKMFLSILKSLCALVGSTKMELKKAVVESIRGRISMFFYCVLSTIILLTVIYPVRVVKGTCSCASNTVKKLSAIKPTSPFSGSFTKMSKGVDDVKTFLSIYWFYTTIRHKLVTLFSSLTFIAILVVCVQVSFKWWYRFFIAHRVKKESLNPSHLKDLLVTGFLAYFPFLKKKMEKKHYMNALKDLAFAVGAVTTSGVALFSLINTEELLKAWDALKDKVVMETKCKVCGKKYDAPVMLGSECDNCETHNYVKPKRILLTWITTNTNAIRDQIVGVLSVFWKYKRTLLASVGFSAIVILSVVLVFAIPMAYFRAASTLENLLEDDSIDEGRRKNKNKKKNRAKGRKHRRYTARELEQEYYFDEDGNKILICRLCFEEGHIANDCPYEYSSGEGLFSSVCDKIFGSNQKSTSVVSAQEISTKPERVVEKEKPTTVINSSNHVIEDADFVDSKQLESKKISKSAEKRKQYRKEVKRVKKTLLKKLVDGKLCTIRSCSCNKEHDPKIFCDKKGCKCWKFHENKMEVPSGGKKESLGINPAINDSDKLKVYEVVSGSSRGTAFVLKHKNRSYFVTAEHVLPKDSLDVQFVSSSGETFTMKRTDVFRVSEEDDIAVFKAPNHLPGFALDTVKDSSVGIGIIYYNFDVKTLKRLNMSFCTGVGTISGNSIRYSALSTESGASGAPLITKSKVIGWHTSGHSLGGSGRLFTPTLLSSLN